MNAIVIVDTQWAIGCGGDLLFSLPTDMKRFRSLTMDGTVIVGRKTLDSFPGGNPLPKRRNIVVTRCENFERPDCEVVHSPEEALKLIDDPAADDVWVIGGGTVYTALLHQCKRVYLTRVNAVATQADTYFPNLDKLPNWKVEYSGEPMTENGLEFRFVNYVNISL